MTYSRSKKLTDTEKKMQTLRTQLYGKESSPLSPASQNHPAFSFKSGSFTTVESLPKTLAPTSFLRNDLLKIAVLASSAISIQLFLYLAVVRGIVKF